MVSSAKITKFCYKLFSKKIKRASNGIRTRDLYLTKVTLYQAELSKHKFVKSKILIILHSSLKLSKLLNFTHIFINLEE